MLSDTRSGGAPYRTTVDHSGTSLSVGRGRPLAVTWVHGLDAEESDTNVPLASPNELRFWPRRSTCRVRLRSPCANCLRSPGALITVIAAT